MASDTSSDLNINLDNKQNTLPSIKDASVTTDFYLNLAANPSKTLVESVETSSSLHYNNDDSVIEDMSENNSTVSKKSEVFNNDSINNNSPRKLSKKSSKHKSHKSSKHKHHHSVDSSASSSKAKYHNVTISPENKSSKKPVLSSQDIRMKKIDLLRKLSEIKTKGYKLSKEYDFNSSLEEMEYEYDLLKNFAERRNGIKLYKNTILNVSNIIEFFNNKYDPFGFQLEGWSEHMNIEIDSYDDVMEELYEKYKSKGKSMPPELKLLLLVGASATAFHFSKSHLSKMPGMGGIMNAQPEIVSKIINNKKPSQFMSEQELNIMKQKQEIQEKEKALKQKMRQQYQPPQQQQQYQPPPQQQQYQPPQPPPQQSTVKNNTPVNFQNTHQSVNFNNVPPADPKHKINNGIPSRMVPSSDPRDIQSKNTIKKSDSVKEILSRLHNREIDTIDTQDETSTMNDRIISDTLTDSAKSKGKKKKNLMTVT